jgi:hypothetical protein
VTAELYGNGEHLPLDPSNEDDLEQLYLPVDQTDEEFKKFKDRVTRTKAARFSRHAPGRFNVAR